MKKLVIAALAASTAFATPAFAQSSDTATITTSVALVCTIDAPAGGTVPLTGNVGIGNVTAQCNDFDGFTATLSSANLGKMVGTGGNTSTVPYTYTITGVQVAPQDLTTSRAYPGPAYLTPVSFAMQVQTAGTSGPAYADTYSDTITFAIAAN